MPLDNRTGKNQSQNNLILCKTQQSEKTGNNHSAELTSLNGRLQHGYTGHLHVIHAGRYYFGYKKQELVSLYKPSDSRLLFLAKVLSFGMERQFIKRDTRNQKLIAGGVLSPIVLDYIMDSEVPKPCRHFLGREEELDELHTLFEENRHIFLYGIAGIGKSELAKAYAKQYRKQYTNILYMEYTGNLYQNITDMDFIDDPPEISEQERFQRHNRFLRSLKSDTLLIIDNFNVTSTQDSCLSVVLKYRCRVLFTTRSQLSEYCSFQLKELKDIATLFQLTSVFYSEAEEHRAIVEKS